MKHLLTTLSVAALAFAVEAQDAPQITNNPQFARGATMAFTRATFKSVNGNTISERGFCYSSTNQEPTIDDTRCKTTLSNNGLIFWHKNLEPATIYYTRPYAIGKNGAISYGDVIRIITLPKGTIAWNYDNGGSAEENDRINTAVETCVNWWNDLTSISNLTLSVHYGAQTPTADCSYGGWMRVGPNSSYQRTGTIMHEALHAIGVGQHDRWYGSNTPLRAGSGTGLWLGDRANEVLRFWNNDATAQLTGDNTHMWPYGINGAHEDDGSNLTYIGSSLICQALGEDGLPPTSYAGNAVPYYAFDHQDDVRYYIKNESEGRGLLTSYLIETSDHNLQWKQLSSAEATASDAAAWYVTFTPDNQYYQIRNAATGRYISYSKTGSNGFTTATVTKPSANENIQLMRSRIDPTASGTVITDIRAYWFIHAENWTLTPQCLSANASGVTAASNFDLTNAASHQRWLLLTAEQTADMENTALIAARASFNASYQQISKLQAVAHADLTQGATETFAATLSQLSAEAAATHSTETLASLSEQLVTAAKTFLVGVYATDLEHPFDLTFFMSNPAFDGNYTGWTVASGGTYGYHSVEFYQCKANVFQTLKAMPAGTYQLRAQAFQRPGSYTQAYDDYTSGTDNVNSRLYLESASKGYVFIKNLMADRSASSLHSDDKKMSDGTWVPNTMASTEAHFKAGYYENLVEYYRAAAGDLKVGLISGDNSSSAYWAIFSNFRLYYLGVQTRAEIENNINAIADVHVAPAVTSVYDLSGRYVGADVEPLPAGLYIVNGKKMIKR